MEQFGVKEILLGILAFGQVFGAIVLVRGLDALLSIREHLAKLNGRVETCEELRKAHDKNEDNRHNECDSRLRDVEKVLRGKQS